MAQLWSSPQGRRFSKGSLWLQSPGLTPMPQIWLCPEGAPFQCYPRITDLRLAPWLPIKTTRGAFKKHQLLLSPKAIGIVGGCGCMLPFLTGSRVTLKCSQDSQRCHCGKYITTQRWRAPSGPKLCCRRSRLRSAAGKGQPRAFPLSVGRTSPHLLPKAAQWTAPWSHAPCLVTECLQKKIKIKKIKKIYIYIYLQSEARNLILEQLLSV